VNVAMSSGTVLGVGVEFQLLPWVHSLETGAPPPIQVPSVACAAFGANAASAPSQTLPSSAARGAAGAAARGACGRHRYERIPQPLRAAPAAPKNRPAANATGGTGNDQFAVEPLGADCRRLWPFRHAGSAGTQTRSALTRVTRIFQERAFTKTTHEARVGDRRGLFCRAVRAAIRWK
jgi:hypothetical protein